MFEMENTVTDSDDAECMSSHKMHMEKCT